MRYNWIYLSLIVAALIGGYFATAQNADGCEDEIFCPNDCSVRAPKCGCNQLSCDCVFGYSGDDCSITIDKELPVPTVVLRIFLSTSFAICAAIGVFAYFSFFCGRQSKTSEYSTMFFNVKKAVLVVLVLLCIDSILYCIAESLDLYLPFVLIHIIAGFAFPLLSLLYTLVLFHWADIYKTTTKILKKEKMLEKINSKYESRVTLDDVVSKTKFMNKLRIPFLLLNGFAFIVQLGRDISFIAISPPRAVHYIWSFTFLILYLFEGVGFLIYGRKVVSILPTQLARKMKTVTRNISIIAVLFIVTFILAGLSAVFLATQQNTWVYLIGLSLWRVALLVIICFILSLFGRLRMRRRAPWFVWSVDTSSSSKPSTPSADKSTTTNQGEPVEFDIEQMDEKEEGESMDSSSES